MRLHAGVRFRLIRIVVALAGLALVLDGCANPKVIESAVPQAAAPKAATPKPAKVAVASPAASPAVAPVVASRSSCTDRWKSHGHTTQPEAQAFAKSCLAGQGAVAKMVDQKTVTRKLAYLIDAEKPLSGLEPSDIGVFCPGYLRQGRGGRAVFWRTLLADLVSAESVNSSSAAYWEEDQDQYSIGLLQLSLSDEQRYHCGFKSEVDITDPDRNLACGVKIVTMLVGADGALGGGEGTEMKGIGAYWQNLRRPSEVRGKLIAATRAIPQCVADPRNA
ncbi:MULTISPECIES: hypothetical protein [unclassified Mesorhizobium]|uniref:hypothetical protein n=1 Tax=unclassified Mesorhizobium TaxID=325217 RepID=UPI00112715BE|nr:MULTISPECIES: hypothetical protein [unclassified Mesorhizobium]TPK96024.1 hypothetical protein FJ567_21770 [Mesorhizobium sp. B2-4-16]TPL61944.1 hypothetical protein FJ956_25880 [Mesorhizobium sp. B2-4-3]